MSRTLQHVPLFKQYSKSYLEILEVQNQAVRASQEENESFYRNELVSGHVDCVCHEFKKWLFFFFFRW